MLVLGAAGAGGALAPPPLGPEGADGASASAGSAGRALTRAEGAILPIAESPWLQAASEATAGRLAPKSRFV